MFKIPWSYDGILIVKSVSCCRYRDKYIRKSQQRDSGGNILREETQPSAGRKAESKDKAVEDVWKGKSRSDAEDSFSFFPLCRRPFREQQSSLHFVMPVPLHTGTQCRQSPGRIILLAFNKSL